MNLKTIRRLSVELTNDTSFYKSGVLGGSFSITDVFSGGPVGKVWFFCLRC